MIFLGVKTYCDPSYIFSVVKPPTPRIYAQYQPTLIAVGDAQFH